MEQIDQKTMDAIIFLRSRPRSFSLSKDDTILTITVRGKPYKLTKGSRLGKGGNCTVFKYEGSGLKYALRTCEDDDSEKKVSEELNPTGLTAKQWLIRTKTKIKIEETDEGPVKYEENTYTYIMECYDMDLNHYLFKYNPDRETKLRILNKVRKLILGLAMRNHYYMDLKPANILCNVKTEWGIWRTIDIDSIVLGDIGSLNYYGNKTLISTFPPPESQKGDPGIIYVNKHTKENLSKMLSYLMGIMIVALFKPELVNSFYYDEKIRKEVMKDLKKSKDSIVLELGNTYVNYLNADVTKRKGLDVEITDKDLPPEPPVAHTNKKRKLGLQLKF